MFHELWKKYKRNRIIFALNIIAPISGTNLETLKVCYRGHRRISPGREKKVSQKRAFSARHVLATGQTRCSETSAEMGTVFKQTFAGCSAPKCTRNLGTTFTSRNSLFAFAWTKEVLFFYSIPTPLSPPLGEREYSCINSKPTSKVLRSELNFCIATLGSAGRKQQHQENRGKERESVFLGFPRWSDLSQSPGYHRGCAHLYTNTVKSIKKTSII